MDSADNSMRVSVHPSWVIVFAGVCAALHVGKLPPAVSVLQATLDISLLQASFLLSALQIAGMTMGLFVGLAVDGIGLDRKSTRLNSSHT